MIGSASLSLILCLALTQPSTDQPKNWKGIIPLHSTRADVERLLGPPPPPPKDGTRLYTPDPNSPLYFFQDENVQISYMTEALAERMHCSAVPIGTVTWIHVSLKKHPPLSELGIDEGKFETFDPSTPPNIGFKAYVDVVDGMYVCTAGGKVNEFGYYGDASDRQVCPELNRDLKQFCSILVDFYDSRSKSDKLRER